MSTLSQFTKASGKQKLCFVSFSAVIFLLPFSRYVELPLLILALLGTRQLYSQGIGQLFDRAQEKNKTVRLFSYVYLCYLGMILLSSFDSYWLEKTLTVALSSVRFYLAGVAVLTVLNERYLKELLLKVIAVIAVFWVLDALIQYVFTYDLFGRESYPGRLTGVFANHVKLGPVLSLLLPILMIWLMGKQSWLRWLMVIALIVVVILSGSRSAWIMTGFVLMMYWWHHVKGRRWLLLLKSALIAVLLFVVLWFSSDDFQMRIERSVAAFEGNVTALDFALADRLPIWQSAINMLKDHPINGVGAHAFREAYGDYASSDDSWMASGEVGLHAHHWLLEVLAETGLLGFVFFILAAVIMIKSINGKLHQRTVWPYATAIMTAFLPVISTYSIFASFWSICIWWLIIALFLGLQDD